VKKAVAVAALLTVGGPALLALAEGERALSIRAVMHKQYRVSRAPFVRIEKELQSGSPDWEKVRQATRDFMSLAAMLEGKEPNWGEMESWKALIGRHLGDARAMDDAAGARDAEALRAAHRRVSESCKACHGAHRSGGRDARQ
jgi:cytochrome c556